MAYALNYPNAPAAVAVAAAVAGETPAREAPAREAPARETPAQETAAVAPRASFFARLLGAVQRSQMARVERELAIYAPNLHARMKADGDFSRVALSESEKLPSVK